MKNFFNKEIKLCLAPINYVYLIFALMVLIPAYPKYVGFFFMYVSLLHLFNNSIMNKDIEYSMILPITKKDIVKARCLVVAVYQTVFIVISIPFSIIFNHLFGIGNVAGIEPNVAFYGITLFILALCNFAFFTTFYKKACKPGVALLKTGIIFWILYLIVEFPVWTKNNTGIEYFQLLDKIDQESQIKQLPVLISGILIFILGWILTFKKSASNFEKVDL